MGADVDEFLVCVQSGDVGAVRRMLDEGADVNGRALLSRYRALYIAAGRGYTEIAELLISRGADVNAYDNDVNETALFAAQEAGHKDLVAMLAAAGARLAEHEQP